MAILLMLYDVDDNNTDTMYSCSSLCLGFEHKNLKKRMKSNEIRIIDSQKVEQPLNHWTNPEIIWMKDGKHNWMTAGG